MEDVKSVSVHLSYHCSLNWMNVIPNNEKSGTGSRFFFFFSDKLRTSTQNDTEVHQRVKSWNDSPVHEDLWLLLADLTYPLSTFNSLR